MDRIRMDKTAGIVLNKAKTFSKPQNIILLLFGIVCPDDIRPLLAIVHDTFVIHPGTIDAHLTKKDEGYSIVNYIDLFTSKLAKVNLWFILAIQFYLQPCLVSSQFSMAGFLLLVTRTNLD